jgi:hypothetical protein
MKRPTYKNPLLSPEVRPLTRKSPKPVPTVPKKKKDCDCPKGPLPTKAESDYIQNGLQFPKQKNHLQLLLKDIQQKGYLDKEYAYRLRQKEAVKGLTKRIEGQIEAGTAKGEGEADKGLEYDPLLESKMGLFERAFRRVLEVDIKSTSCRASQ